MFAILVITMDQLIYCPFWTLSAREVFLLSLDHNQTRTHSWSPPLPSPRATSACMCAKSPISPFGEKLNILRPYTSLV